MQTLVDKSKGPNFEEKDEQQASPLKKDDIRFSALFPNIIEDDVDSSDDNEERKKNERLERLGKIAAAPERM